MKSRESRNNVPDSPHRRKALKTLAVGVGALAGSTVLPEKWVTPIIQGIVLPVHAQTSAPLAPMQLVFCNDRVDLTLIDGDSSTVELTIEASGCIIPAQANVELTLAVCSLHALF
ncbi:MAG: twin-arginine translocation signal domain-containing protein [Candidatus Electrothrix sp. GM3_4]|nr:twin-arginine translocation signal domain-containing protein [Candidatus Electrothrix sp. GM3_4]